MFSIIIGAIIVTLVGFLIFTILSNPKSFFIDAPITIVELVLERVGFYLVIIALPIWFPIWLIDKIFKIGVFQHPLFKKIDYAIFGFSSDSDDFDKDYPVKRHLEVDFKLFTKYFITTNQDSDRVIKTLDSYLDNHGDSLPDHEISKIGRLTVIKLNDISLYNFFFLIQVLKNEFKRSKSCGFAISDDLSFYGEQDKNTLNNVIGKTSEGDAYAYRLASHEIHEHSLGINSSIKIETDYSIEKIKEAFKQIF